MSVDILALFQAHGLHPVKVTAVEWSSPCPACGGRDRCRIWPEDNAGRGAYWCRQCEASGDSIQFLRDYENLSYQEACQRVGVPAVAGSSLPRLDRGRGREVAPFSSAPTPPPSEVWAAKATAFVGWAHEHLLANPEQLAWLAARGLPLEAVRRYKLGWNPGQDGKTCLIRPRKAWGLPPVEKTNKDGTKTQKSTMWIPRGLVIPHLDAQGAVRRVRIRRPEADRERFLPETKYFVVPGSSMDALILGHESRAKIVVESELDGFMLHHQVGDLAGVVAVMTAQVKELDAVVHGALESALCILVALDFDKAGAEGWPRWEKSFPRAVRWPVPVGKDPGEAFEQGANLRAWVLAGLPPVLSPVRFQAQASAVPGPSHPGQPACAGEGEGARTEAKAPEARRDPLPERLKLHPAPLRAFRPVDRLYWPRDAADALACLEGCGLAVRASDGRRDYVVHGHERWPMPEWLRLLAWVHHHGDLVAEALGVGGAPVEMERVPGTAWWCWRPVRKSDGRGEGCPRELPLPEATGCDGHPTGTNPNPRAVTAEA